MGTKLCGCNKEEVQDNKEQNVFIYSNNFLISS
jgi:hypothetical protein